MKTTPMSLALIAFFSISGALIGQIKVLTTTPDFCDIAQQLAGSHAKVSSLTDGTEDLHLVKIRPSTLIKVRRADLLIRTGFSAEHSWLPALLKAARHQKIQYGRENLIDASAGIKALRIPTSLDRRRGVDLHPQGNPHYTLDPLRMKLAAKNILKALKRVLPAKASEFDAAYLKWEKQLQARLKTWTTQLSPHKGSAFIEHHDAWIYFADRFGLNIVARLESQPGLAPKASHIAKVIALGRKKKVNMVVARPLNAALARRVAHDIKAQDIILPLRSHSQGKLKGWFQYMDTVVATFAKNLSRSQ